MRTKTMKVEAIKFDLPEGVVIADRPAGLEFLTRTKNKWMGVVQKLENLPATKCFELNLGDMMDMSHVNHKNKLASIKSSIKNTAKDMGYNARIKFALKGNILYIWS